MCRYDGRDIYSQKCRAAGILPDKFDNGENAVSSSFLDLMESDDDTLLHDCAGDGDEFGSFSNCAAGFEQDARQAAQSVLDAWNKTELQKDAAAHAALYTEDAVQVTPEGLISGRESIESHAAADYKSYTGDPSKLQQVTMIGTGVMLRAGTWSGTYNGPNGPVHLKGFWSDVDVHDGNTWKIKQETYNVTPP